MAGDGAHEVGAVVGGAAAGDADEGAAEVVVGEVGDGGFPGFDFAAITLKDVAADGGAEVAAEMGADVRADSAVAQFGRQLLDEVLPWNGGHGWLAAGAASNRDHDLILWEVGNGNRGLTLVGCTLCLFAPFDFRAFTGWRCLGGLFAF